MIYTTQYLKELIQAKDQGKTIQARSIYYNYNDESKWGDCYSDNTWDFSLYNYRVKPEPREWWLSENLVGYGTEEEARKYGSGLVIHVREVL